MNFSRLEEHRSCNPQGTGLGLSICKSLLELMGGKVTVESKVSVGTTFIMSLNTKCNY
jgi:signal transduction histidine kinase